MSFGLTDKQEKTIRDVLSSYQEVETAMIFGSRAMNTFEAGSDVDIALKGKVPRSTIVSIKSELEDTTLPYFFDILDYASINEPKLKEQIDKHGKIFYLKGWKKTTLGEVAKIISGGTPKTSVPEYWNGDIPWLSVTDFNNENRWVNQTEKHITKKGLENSSTKLLDAGDIVISDRGTVGVFAQLKRPMAFNQSCYGIKENTNSTKDFLFYLIKQNNNQLKKNVHGAVFDTITRNTFDQIEILLPSIQEQRAIAAVLSSLDDKIELLREQNKTLESTAQAIYKEWFVKFNFPGATGKMIDSELGEIPEGWRVGKLTELFDFMEGPGIRNWQYTQTGRRFINIRLIQNGDINIKDANFISEEEAETAYRHFHLQEKDMVVSTSGTLGRCAIVRKEHLPLMLNTSVIRFRPIDKISYGFMYQYLNSNFFKNELESLASGSVQLNFGPVHLKQIEMVVPPEDMLQKFAGAVNPLYEKMCFNLSQIQTLATLRDTLLPKLMRGEIRVKI